MFDCFKCPVGHILRFQYQEHKVLIVCDVSAGVRSSCSGAEWLLLHMLHMALFLHSLELWHMQNTTYFRVCIFLLSSKDIFISLLYVCMFYVWSRFHHSKYVNIWVLWWCALSLSFSAFLNLILPRSELNWQPDWTEPFTFVANVFAFDCSILTGVYFLVLLTVIQKHCYLVNNILFIWLMEEVTILTGTLKKDIYKKTCKLSCSVLL